jgi:cyclin C
MEDSGLIKKSTLEYNYFMRIYIHSLVNKLGRRLNVRQVALSTAEVYLKRFLTRASLKEVNLYLSITTAIYLACKIEECPQHIRTIVSEARNIWPEYISQDTSKVAEFEFYLIEELDTYLIVHHPYKSLLLTNDALSEFNSKQLANGMHQLQLSPEELQSSWSVINDSYVTDLHLLFPPHIISTTAIYLTIVLKYNHLTHLHKDTKNEGLATFVQFLGHSNIDLEEVVEAVQEMVTLYEVWESYDEAECKRALESVYR